MPNPHPPPRGGDRAQRTLWEEGRTPGREVVALATAIALTALLLDVWLSADLGLLFDLVFVTVCVGAALLVRPEDFFTVGTWPPLAMVGAIALLAITDPAAVADAGDGTVQAVVSGLSTHSVALVLGYAACLALLAVRRRFEERASRPPGGQTNRSGSPAPRRRTSGTPSE